MSANLWIRVIADGVRFHAGFSFLLGLIWTSAVLGAGPLFPGAQYAAGDGPSSVAIGDLNGDQVPDLAVTNGDSDNVSVLLGVGDGTFAAAVNYPAGDEPTSVAIGDLDGDLVPDLAVTTGGTYPEHEEAGVSILLGIGDGTFAAAEHCAAAGSPLSVAIGDLDGDQVPDLALATRGTYPEYDNGGVSVLLGVGDGTFAAAAHYAAGDYWPSSIAIGDLDGDQVPDLAVASLGTYPEYADGLSVLLGLGDGTFAAAVNYFVGVEPQAVAIDDLDGDQVPDLVLAIYGTYSEYDDAGVSVLLGLGDGTFAAPVHYAATGRPVSVAIGDLNGDGVLDLAAGNDYGNEVSVLLGLGYGTFAAAVTYPAGDPWSVALGDLDGDQVLDLAMATIGSYVTVLLGVGDGTFVAAKPSAVGPWPCSVAIDDLNGDQAPDLVVANGYYGDYVSVLLGLGDGTFAAAVEYAAGDGPRSVAIGDLDGNQVPDLAVATRAHVSVLLGLSDGTFAGAVHYAAGIGPRSVAIGDLDGDQVPDLALAMRGTHPEYDDGGVLVLLGLGDGTFAAAEHYPTEAAAYSLGIGDLDGDQVPDLAVANFYSDSVSVLPGLGDGTFAAAVHYAAGFGPRSVAIGDLDRDQVPDLVVANGGSDDVSVLLGVGDGTFGVAAHYATAGDGPESVAIGDLDGDQVLDLVVANGNISVLLGIGDGTFVPAVPYAAGGRFPRSVAIGDLDGDQMPDLAVANYWSENVSVLPNQRPTPCDIDGDDDVDLADFALFVDCMGGPGVTTPPPGCDPADFARADLQGNDGDVDLNDCALFQRQFRGSL